MALRTLPLTTLAIFVILTQTGCETYKQCSLTYKLWNNPDMRSFAEPAENPHLELYLKKPDDVLVAYDEMREQDDKTRRRAYFLARNVHRISQNKKPGFANPERASELAPIHLLAQGDRTNSVPFAIYQPQSKRFLLVGVGGIEGSHDLPVYVNNGGNVARTALTPLAVAADVTVVTCAAAFVAGYAYAVGLVHH